MSIRPTSFGVGETWTWNIRLRNLANAAVDADSTPTVTVYKNNAATGESVTVTKPSATTGWYQCSFDPAGEAEHDVYSFVENVTIAAVAQAPFQWEAVVLASVGAGGLDAAGVRAAVGLASANMDTQLSGISNKTTNLPSDPADQSIIIAATDAILTRLGTPASTVSDDIAAVKTDTGDLVTRITANLFSGITYLSRWLGALAGKTADSTTLAEITATTAGAGYDNTTDSLQAIKDSQGSGGSSGTGARTVTITVNDGLTALQNATVRMTEGVNTYTALTNVSGVAVFNLDDATYTVSITKIGYTYAGTTIVVNGTETETYSMAAMSITPGTGSFTTGYVTAYDDAGATEEGVDIYVEMVKVPAGDTGITYDSRVRTLTSDSDGLVEIPGLAKGGTYRIWRGLRANNTYLIPTSAGSTYALPSIIGREQ